MIRSKKMNKKIFPRLTSAHNYYNDTLPVYRFLCDMQHQGKRTTFGLDWGELADHLDYKPRVRYGNSILSLASWRVRQDEIIAFFSHQTLIWLITLQSGVAYEKKYSSNSFIGRR